MPWGVAAAAVGAYGAIKSSKNNKEAAAEGATTKQELDPRAQAIIYGDGTSANPGLLSQYQALGQSPQMAGSANFGHQSQQFLGTQGGNILGQLQTGSGNLLNSSIAAPQSAGTQANNVSGAGVIWNKGAQVSAPSQNGIDLSASYNKFINGDAGANPYLTKALQAGVDMTNTSFQKNAGYAKDALDSSLSGIRGNSVLAGQYGSSRQGVAEGNALKSYSDQLTNANLQLAQTNSANTTGAQAQAFNQGQDRALAATQGLGAQQYGVAGQNAGYDQQARLQNQSIANQTDQFNVNQLNNMSQFNASLGQSNNQFNAGQQAQSNALNSQNQQAGLAGMSGLLSNTYGYAQNQDNYAINRAGQVNGLLGPYLGAGSSTNTTQPYASNTAANILGGATAGLGLYNGIRNAYGTPNAQNVQPYQPNAQNVTPGTY